MLDKMYKIKNTKKIIFFAVFVGLLFSVFTPSYAQNTYYVEGGSFNSGTNNSNTQPTITTSNAINITPTSATLTALLNGNNIYSTYNVSTWFDYGTTVNLGTSSSGHAANFGYASFVSNISGLTPNTVYYFRAMGQGPKGITYGGINSFRTTIPPLPIDNSGANNLAGTSSQTYIAPSPTPTNVKTPTVITKKEEVKKQDVPETENQNTNNSFLPMTILGWILLVILILILILTIKHLHLKFTDKKNDAKIH